MIDTSFAVIVQEAHGASGRTVLDILFQDMLAQCASMS